MALEASGYIILKSLNHRLKTPVTLGLCQRYSFSTLFIFYLFPNSYCQCDLFDFQAFPFLLYIACFKGNNYLACQRMLCENLLHLSALVKTDSSLNHLGFFKVGKNIPNAVVHSIKSTYRCHFYSLIFSSQISVLF